MYKEISRQISFGLILGGLLSACGNDGHQTSAPLDVAASPVSWHNAIIDQELGDSSLSQSERDHANDIKRRCSANTVHGIDGMAVYHDKNHSKTFTYYYEQIITDASLPTIVYLTGGPGGSQIGNIYEFHYNYIEIDPRGLGCNFGSKSDFDLDALTSWQTAMDVVEVIRAVGLKDYVIYGVSYGTLLGTVLAHELEQAQGLTPPKAVVLDGVLGHSIRSYVDYYDAHIAQWTKLTSAEPTIKSMFSSVSLPLSASAQVWGSYLIGIGEQYEQARSDLLALESELPAFTASGTIGPTVKKFQDLFQDIGSRAYEARYNDYQLVFTSVGCQEIFTSWKNSAFQVNPDSSITIIPDANAPQDDQCAGIQFSHPYDSAAYQVSAPIYYFQGDVDPSTPLALAQYHADHQSHSAAKRFTLVKDGGHDIMGDGYLEACMNGVWSAIMSQGALDSVIDSNGRCKN